MVGGGGNLFAAGFLLFLKRHLWFDRSGVNQNVTGSDRVAW